MKCPKCLGTGSHGLNPYELAQRYGTGRATQLLDALKCGACNGTGVRGDVMTDGELLLRAVLTDPADDTVRLAYADWLDEVAGQHTERAEFIRVQVELARTPAHLGVGTPIYQDVRTDFYGSMPLDRVLVGFSGGVLPNPRHVELAERERELLEANRTEWLANGPCVMDAWSLDEPMVPYAYGMRVLFRRGLVAELVSTAADFMAHAPALFVANPITRVVLTDREPDLFDLGDDEEPRVWNTQEFVVLGAARSLLPSELFDLLPEPHQPSEYPGEWVGRDGAHARDALSAACVRYGRRLAGLPDLTRAQVAPPAVPTQQAEG